MNNSEVFVNKSAFTPMMQQYLDVKEQYSDSILMYRLGDFYEMFFDDAKTVSKELDLTLTGKACGLEERAPMCGVPFHSADGYIARLVANGHKVAVCEQTEDPALAKGLVKREVVRLITPGTVIESSMLDESSNSFISSVYKSGQDAGVCFCDVSTGEAFATVISGKDITQKIINELSRFNPKETLISEEAISDLTLTSFIKDKLSSHIEKADSSRYDNDACLNLLEEHFKSSVSELNTPSNNSLFKAAGGLLSYLHETQKNSLSHIDKLQIYSLNQYMTLDYNTRRNLELTSAMRSGEKKGSLLWVLDNTVTAAGARLLRQWIEKPLLNVAAIQRRHFAVASFMEHKIESDDLVKLLRSMCDIERVSAKTVYGTANARDLKALSRVIGILPEVKSILSRMADSYLKKLSDDIDELADIFEAIEGAIVDEPPFSVREAGIIKPGYDKHADELRDLLNGGAERLAEIEEREKNRTGIPKLKVSYNSVFGYYIEVTKSYASQVPDDYIRKQTLVGSERYITPELKKLEGEVVSAKEKLSALEYSIFTKIRDLTAQAADRIKKTSHAIASADALRSFAAAAEKYNYVMPEVNEKDKIEISDGRHPVVERLLQGGLFVPNDMLLDGNENNIYLITGPNMAGKSTYMRQAALITIMAQCGSFVPAKKAVVGVCDRVFTRIGASDDMTSGQSTFMVEMNEVAEILKYATSKSLLILDEIGRGTSTFDGMSIARAVIEYCSSRIRAKTLFATHYHELCDMEGQIKGVKNYNIAVKKHGEKIVFIKKIVRGGTSDSYGIDVAGLAGIPNEILKRAKEILSEIEKKSSFNYSEDTVFENTSDDTQLSFESFKKDEIIKKLKDTDPNVLSPIEALSLIYELNKKAGEC